MRLFSINGDGSHFPPRSTTRSAAIYPPFTTRRLYVVLPSQAYTRQICAVLCQTDIHIELRIHTLFLVEVKSCVRTIPTWHFGQFVFILIHKNVRQEYHAIDIVLFIFYIIVSHLQVRVVAFQRAYQLVFIGIAILFIANDIPLAVCVCVHCIVPDGSLLAFGPFHNHLLLPFVELSRHRLRTCIRSHHEWLRLVVVFQALQILEVHLYCRRYDDGHRIGIDMAVALGHALVKVGKVVFAIHHLRPGYC